MIIQHSNMNKENVNMSVKSSAQDIKEKKWSNCKNL